jgi:hypothetical protein
VFTAAEPRPIQKQIIGKKNQKKQYLKKNSNCPTMEEIMTSGRLYIFTDKRSDKHHMQMKTRTIHILLI